MRALWREIFIERHPSVALPVDALEHVGGMLLKIDEMNAGELIKRHARRIVGGGGEASRDHRVELRMRDLPVVVEVEVAQQAIGKPVAMQEALHGPVRR